MPCPPHPREPDQDMPSPRLPREILDQIFGELIRLDEAWDAKLGESFDPRLNSWGAFAGVPFQNTGITSLMSLNHEIQRDLTIRILRANTLRFSRAEAFSNFFNSICTLHGHHFLDNVSSLRFQNMATRGTDFQRFLVFLGTLSEENGFVLWPRGGMVFERLQTLEISFRLYPTDHRMGFGAWWTMFSRTMFLLAKLQMKEVTINGLRQSPNSYLKDIGTGRSRRWTFCGKWVRADFLKAIARGLKIKDSPDGLPWVSVVGRSRGGPKWVSSQQEH